MQLIYPQDKLMIPLNPLLKMDQYFDLKNKVLSINFGYFLFHMV